MLTMVEYVHKRIESYASLKVGVDFTMGNGKDTKFLLDMCEFVYAFDIQEIALDKTRCLIQNNERAKLILDDHKFVKNYIEEFDVGIFNLGYLPEGNHDITTVLESTKMAISQAIEMMNQAVFIVAYPGHKQGQDEASWLESYVTQLSSRKYNISKYCMMNKKNSPFVIEIEKRHEASF